MGQSPTGTKLPDGEEAVGDGPVRAAGAATPPTTAVPEPAAAPAVTAPAVGPDEHAETIEPGLPPLEKSPAQPSTSVLHGSSGMPVRGETLFGTPVRSSVDGLSLIHI